jgi:Uma2 family endonuclease
MNPDGVLRLVPPLVVEVLSPSITTDEMARKLRVYGNAGVAAVWILDPVARTAEIHRRDLVRTLSHGEVLSEPDILPGFAIALSSIFE